MSSPLNISCIIAAHHEGIMLHWSLLSYEAMRLYAEERGACVEWIVVLDKANEETKRIASQFPGLRATDKVIYAEHGSPSLTRNTGIAEAQGDIICILDGDDYYTKNFLWEGANLAAQNTRYIVHPHYMFSFGVATSIHELWDMREHPEIDASALVFQHPWSAAVIAQKSVFHNVPYLSFEKGFGFEDWQWNCETMSRNYIHITAKQTILFYRRRTNGTLATSRNAIMPPTSLFNMGLPPEAPNAGARLLRSETFPTWRKRTLSRWRHSVYKRLPVFMQKTLSRWNRSLMKRLPAGMIDRTAQRQREFYRAALLEISRIDPRMHPSRFPDVLPEYVPHLYKDRGALFLKLCQQYTRERYDVVYVVPWLIPGGADLMILNHANVCARHGKKVLVVTTVDSKTSTWASRLDATVELLELGTRISSLPWDVKITFLTKLLLQMAPSNIHFINSQLGHECLKRHGDALKQYSSLISTFYCDDVREDGTLDGYVVDYLTDEYAHVCKYTSDNAVLPKEWCLRYGTDLGKFHITYGLIQASPAARYAEMSRAVFWASRICDQKRPDILYHVAKGMPSVTFHVYGEPYDNDVADVVTKLEQLPNVELKGAFSGFQSIPLENYAAMLYTSKSDGLPNVLLEAGEAAMPVAASVVGGISDFLTEETGWPVPSNEPADFIEALQDILDHPERAAARGRKARELVLQRHSEQAFWANLAELYSFAP